MSDWLKAFMEDEDETVKVVQTPAAEGEAPVALSEDWETTVEIAEEFASLDDQIKALGVKQEELKQKLRERVGNGAVKLSDGRAVNVSPVDGVEVNKKTIPGLIKHLTEWGLLSRVEVTSIDKSKLKALAAVDPRVNEIVTRPDTVRVSLVKSKSKGKTN